MKAPTRSPTALDHLTTRLRNALRSETTNVIEVGKLLIESRKLLKHGEWQSWLSKKFDMSLRSAFNYESAAKYVARHKSATVADLAPGVLYALATGRYSKKEEAAILAAARKGRVDGTRAAAICTNLVLRFTPPPLEDDAGSAPPEATPPAAGDDSPAAILDGPPPAVPPPAPIATPDFMLRGFDQAVSMLKGVMTKSATQFVRTAHSTSDLEVVASFIQAVSRARCEK
jgi:hypothetical protein